LEKLGHLDPLVKDPDKQLVLNKERVAYWLSQGAVPSETVSEILLKQGIPNKAAEQRIARRAKARAIAKAQGKHFTKADRIAAEKKAEEEKLAAEAAAKAAAEEAKAKAEADAKAAEEAAKDEGGSGE
jgi:small subunit ribosomal protein S16